MKYEDIIANAPYYAQEEEGKPVVLIKPSRRRRVVRRTITPTRRVAARVSNESLLRPVPTIQRERDIDYSLGYSGADTNMQYYNNGDVNTLLNNYVI
jgi:hypothetical protein